MISTMETMHGIEIRGYEMRCGIYIFTIVDAISGDRNFILDSNMDLSEALKKLSEFLEFKGFEFNREYMTRTSDL